MLIAFLGDSLTEGWPGAASFPLLDRRMKEHELLNRGRAGDTVADLLNRMRYQGLTPVDVAFVWVGANDAVIGAWDAADPGSGWSWPERLMRLAGDYEELLEWTEARAPRIVVVRPLVLEAEGSLWEQRAGEVAEAIAATRPAGAPVAWWTCCRRSRPRPATVTARSPPTACTSPTPAPRSLPRPSPRSSVKLRPSTRLLPRTNPRAAPARRRAASEAPPPGRPRGGRPGGAGRGVLLRAPSAPAALGRDPPRSPAPSRATTSSPTRCT